MSIYLYIYKRTDQDPTGQNWKHQLWHFRQIDIVQTKNPPFNKTLMTALNFSLILKT